MVKMLPGKIKPTRGFAHIFHLSFIAVMPIAVYLFVRLELLPAALAIVLLSKWRIFAVRPRHWMAHLRTNAVDLIFSLSMLAFMISADSMSIQLLWVLIFEIWVLYIKPGTKAILVSLQALIAQMVGLTALFLAFETAPLAVYVAAAAGISYFCARHFFGSFDDRHFNAYCTTWSLFAAALTWVLGHWLLFIGPVAHIAILLGAIAYGLGALYYLSETDRLSTFVQRQVGFVVIVVVLAILATADWTGTGV